MSERRRIGEILVDESLVGPERVAVALDEQAAARKRQRLGDLLVERGDLQPGGLVHALAVQNDADTVNPLTARVHPPTLWKVPRDVAERCCALVIQGEQGPVLVMGNPDMPGARRTVAACLGTATLPLAVAEPGAVLAAIARHYDVAPARARAVQGLAPEERPAVLSPTGLELDTRSMITRVSRGPGKPVADFVTALLAHGIHTGAERLCIDNGAVRLTHDGAESELMDLPAVHAAGVVARLRAVLKLDTSLARAASGRADLAVGTQALRVKVDAAPGPAGGRIVVDLVDPASATPPDLGLSRKVDAAWTAMRRAPGLVLLVGPEGSGCRGIAASVAGAFYVPLRTAAALEAAVSAAHAGRTVLGRVVATTVPEAIVALRELGTPPWALAQGLTGALATRRLRRLCAHCACPGGVAHTTAQRLGVMEFAAPRPGPGCPACVYRGYAGSVFPAELVIVTDALRDAVERGATLREYASLSRPVADRTLQVDAVARAIDGQTSAAEVDRTVPAPPPWASAPAPRHQGLLRAVTAPPADDDPVPAAPSTRPRVHVVHPGVAERASLRSRLEAHCDLSFGWASVSAGPPPGCEVVVVAHGAPGGWNAGHVADCRRAGTRVVLLGPGPDLARMAEAFALGADDYAGGVEELALRVARLLPDARGRGR